MKYIVCFTLLFILHCIQFGASDNHNEDNWIEPNAFRNLGEDTNFGLSLNTLQLENIDNGQCKTNSDHNAVGLLYFKKFIAALFQRTKLQYDESTDIYQRSLLFTILPEQLAQLEQLNDPRDLDSILSEIFAKTRTPCDNAGLYDGSSAKGMGIAALIWDIFKDLAQLLQTSEIQFVLLLSASILLGYFVHRRYRIGVISLFIGSILFFGFVHTYLECNRKLEIDEMLEVIEKDETSNVKIEPSWYSSISQLFSFKAPPVEDRHKKIKKLSKIKLRYCRPDHVLMMYANDLFLKQLEFLLEKCTSTLIDIKDTLPWPYNYLAAFMLIAIIAYIVKLTFKYILSPKAWIGLMHRPSQQHPQYLQSPNSGVAAINEDRISGENLKLLLNVISAAPSVDAKPLSSASGVQDIVEALAAPNASSSSSENNTPNTSMEEQPLKPHNNNNSITKELRSQKAETTKLTSEDVPPDDNMQA